MSEETRKFDDHESVEDIEYIQPVVEKHAATIQICALLVGGLTFILSAIACIIGLVWHLLASELPKADELLNKLTGFPNIESTLLTLLGSEYTSIFIPPLLLLFTSFVTGLIGFLLLRSAGFATKQVIPRQDYKLLSRLLLRKPEQGIDHYVRLSSLTGVTGIFTKIGLTGLPLATISLTIFFTILSLMSSDKTGTQLFDLAKLTLGAFIGSYVQKSVAAPHVGEEKKDNPQRNPDPA